MSCRDGAVFYPAGCRYCFLSLTNASPPPPPPPFFCDVASGTPDAGLDHDTKHGTCCSLSALHMAAGEAEKGSARLTGGRTRARTWGANSDVCPWQPEPYGNFLTEILKRLASFGSRGKRDQLLVGRGRDRPLMYIAIAAACTGGAKISQCRGLWDCQTRKVTNNKLTNIYCEIFVVQII